MAIQRVFAGAQAKGNLCVVTTPAERQEQRLPNTTRCETRSLGAGRVEVNCYSATGALIDCCGHGMLATTRHWLGCGWPEPLVLTAGKGTVHGSRDGDLFWLDMPRLATRDIAVPAWVEALCPTLPCHAAVAGGDHGYLVLEWPMDFPLQALLPPGEVLGRHTQRALIACVAGEGGEPWLMRYFAPQYGVAEDAATGSAARVLAEYGWQRRGCQRLRVIQCSPAGGELFSRRQGHRVAIGGRVEDVVAEVAR